MSQSNTFAATPHDSSSNIALINMHTHIDAHIKGIYMYTGKMEMNPMVCKYKNMKKQAIQRINSFIVFLSTFNVFLNYILNYHYLVNFIQF